jgi:HK97 family phage prohead protease
MSQIERRFTTAPVGVLAGSVAQSTGRTVRGYAAMFGKWSSNLGSPQMPWYETIEPGAFDGVLNQDVLALFNHDTNYVLARSRGGRGTLRLGIDATGLWYEFSAPETTVGNDLVVSLQRGDVYQSSFGFQIAPGGDKWAVSNGVRFRTVKRVGLLYDVSPVATAAYPDAPSGLRDLNHDNSTLKPSAPVRDLWAARFGLTK